MPSLRVRVISWAALLFLSREATQYSLAILALSWALLALVSAILPRSSKYVLVIMVVATLSTPPSVVVSSSSKHLPTMHPEQLNICSQLRRIPLPRTPVNKVLIRKPSGNVARCVSETHGPPKLPEGYRLDLADDPDAPALRRPDGTVVARFGARGMTHQAVEREALEDLLRTSRKPGGVESELIEALRRPRPT